MARQRKSARPRKVATPETPKTWRTLTWDALDHWAGSRSVSRGRAYQRQGRVKDLALAEDGRLLATVVGNERYVTSAWLGSGKGKSKPIESVCSCPVGASGCKHAVAVVAEFLAALAEERAVPAAEPDDRRWAKLSQDDSDSYDDFDEEDAVDDERFDNSAAYDDVSQDGDDESDVVRLSMKPSKRAPGKPGKRRTRAEWDKRIKAHVEQKNREELTGLVWSFVERFPELRQEFQERIALSEGNVDQLLAAARRELRAVTAELGWRNHWKGEGHTPNYGRLKHRLERLAELGHCDAVVDLGRELIERGMAQVGQSDDEGETAMELSDCLLVVFDALAKSRLSSPDKILYAIDAYLQDDYDVVGDAAGKILDANWSATDWSAVADRLAKRLQNTTPSRGEDDFSRNYQRNRISDYFLDALDRAGRKKELLPIYEAEARETGSYQRLVSYLIAQQRFADAERWAREGIEKTHEKYPGIASGLAQSLCEVARQKKQWGVVAAHAALNFLEHPSVLKFKELIAAAKKAKCEEPVRAAALRFLESGVAPIRITKAKGGNFKATIDPDWPLPVPGYLLSRLSSRLADSTSQPHYSVLIDMAINDKRPAEVLRWHDEMTARQNHANRGPHFGFHYFDSDRVAKAISAEYPERALEIYQRKLDSHLKNASTSAYETCANCLRTMRPIFKALDQEDHWNELVADIRHNYRNRPRFMEILDKLAGRTIVQSHKSSRRR